jgi:NAD(P)-dependent dehydrogenase (short-subunit alcohol dehydrogenase family)
LTQRRFEGKTAVVTGGGGGIGGATAKKLASEGAKVVVADLKGESAEIIAGSIRESGGEAIAVETDVSKEDQVIAMVQSAVDAWGRLDIIHNNAAHTGKPFHDNDQTTLITDLEFSYFLRALEVNLLGVFLGIKHAIPRMLEHGGGAIVNTSSGSAIRAFPDGQTAYGATKAGVESLTRYTAYQFGRKGIRCNCIAPGVTLSPRLVKSMPKDKMTTAEFGTTLPTLSTPEEQAEVVAFLASDESGRINGHTIPTSGGTHIMHLTSALWAFERAREEGVS